MRPAVAHGLSAQPGDLKTLDNSRIQTLSNTHPILSKRSMYICIIDTRLTGKANKDFQDTISTEFVLLDPCCNSFSLYKAALANHIFMVKAREVSQSPSSVNSAFFFLLLHVQQQEKRKKGKATYAFRHLLRLVGEQEAMQTAVLTV